MIYFIVGYFLCGLIAAGFDYAHFQDEYPDTAAIESKEDYKLAFGSFLLGIFSLLACLDHGDYKHGWRLWNKRSKGIR